MRALFVLAVYVIYGYFIIKAIIDVETFWEFICLIVVGSILIPIINIILGFIIAIVCGSDDSGRY